MKTIRKIVETNEKANDYSKRNKKICLKKLIKIPIKTNI